MVLRQAGVGGESRCNGEATCGGHLEFKRPHRWWGDSRPRLGHSKKKEIKYSGAFRSIALSLAGLVRVIAISADKRGGKRN